MFSHGFMSFAAIGVTVACLVIMGTFSLVAYNANENLKDLQKENAVLAFVDENLSDNEAKALQSKLEKIPGAASVRWITYRWRKMEGSKLLYRSSSSYCST